MKLELELDRIEGLLAAELPPHLRAFAAAYAAGAVEPPAPAVMHEPATLAIAERAMATPALARRGRALWRLCALAAIEREVGAATGTGWPALAALAGRREAAAQRRWGRGFLAVAHDVFDAGPVEPVATTAPTATVSTRRVTAGTLTALWHELTDLPAPSIIICEARPRTFAVRPGEAIVVVRSDSTVNAWSQALHELGHAWVAIAGLELARTLDESVAISAARTLERREPEARAMHERQHAIAVELAGVARYAGEPIHRDRPPPWALWHDPGAQAAYASAYQRARTVDRLDDLRPTLG
jgi:hypothetical protein